MTHILFVCHGNICRSPMAEFIMKALIRKAGCEKEITVDSVAATTEEIGNDMYPPAKRMLTKKGIPFSPRLPFFWNNATDSSLSREAMESLRLGCVM